MESKILERYNSDQEFHYWFDKAVEISVEQRIKIALFRNNPATIEMGGQNLSSDIVETAAPEMNFQNEFTSAVSQLDVGSESELLEDNNQWNVPNESDDELAGVDFG